MKPSNCVKLNWADVWKLLYQMVSFLLHLSNENRQVRLGELRLFRLLVKSFTCFVYKQQYKTCMGELLVLTLFLHLCFQLILEQTSITEEGEASRYWR